MKGDQNETKWAENAVFLHIPTNTKFIATIAHKNSYTTKIAYYHSSRVRNLLAVRITMNGTYRTLYINDEYKFIEFIDTPVAQALYDSI